MSFHVLSAIIRATMAELVGTRFRSEDLPLIGLLGALYSLANAAMFQLLRMWLGVADSAGTVGENVFRDPGSGCECCRWQLVPVSRRL